MAIPKLTLGLDIGTNSIGWALTEADEVVQRGRIVAAGVRIFQEAVDAKTRVPKNQARRAARALRRILARRRRRREKLRNILIRTGLLPPHIATSPEVAESFNQLGNPYELRRRGLDESLTLHEMGRVLTHLCARRGFQSNKKSLFGLLAEDFEDLLEAAEEMGGTESDESASRKAARDEEGKVKLAISELRQQMGTTGSRTLGEYLANLEPGMRKRGRYTDRQMYKDEFECLWAAQSQYHSEVLSDELKVEIYESIFFQRPLKSAKRLVGRCSSEPTRRRAAVARLESQKFRVLQDVNHLAVRDPKTRLYRDLNPDEQAKIAGVLLGQASLTWGQARKILGLHKNETFNLEDSDREKLKGDTTSAKLSKVLGARWEEMEQESRAALVEDLLTIGDKRHLVKRLAEHWKFDRQVQYALATTELEPGYMALSAKAISRLLPFLQKGFKYHEARRAAGYMTEDRSLVLKRLPSPPLVRNPVVQRAMTEVRKVVNSLVGAHGVPRVIRIEMARDLRLTGKDKERYEKQQRANTKANARAAEQLASVGRLEPTRDDLIKFRLWEECRQECPYTGKPIGIHQLVSSEIDIEHIIPYSRCLDDSFMNKALCFADENRQHKRGQTPWEAYGSDKVRWEGMLQRIKHWPIGKQRRFTNREVAGVDDFIARQLNDTRYISTVVKDYLKVLGSDVQVSKGGVTADLRRIWGLNRLLGFNSEKKERTDHRHHALDAIVIALTDRSRYQRIARESAVRNQASLKHGRLTVPEPWAGFAEAVSGALQPVIVSHAPMRRISGAFHEQTAYGFRSSTGKYHYRKRLDPLFKPTMVESIADPVIKAIVEDRLAEADGDPKRAFSAPLMHRDGRTPIRKVRLARSASPESLLGIPDSHGHVFKYYDLGNNHHIAIYRDESSGQQVGVVVSTIEAATRARRGDGPIVDRSDHNGAKFLMSLMINDMLEVEVEGRHTYYRVQKISNAPQITLRHHLASTLDNNHDRLIRAPSTLNGRKVSVDPIGRVRYASD